MGANNNVVNEYINKRYSRWLEYAAYHCRVSRLNMEPAEVLNDALCYMLEGDTRYAERLVNSKKQGFTEFDFLVLHIIKRNIYSPRSRARYIKGQHCTELVDMQCKTIAAIADQEDDFDVIKAYDTIKETLESIRATRREKEIFAWKFFDGNSYRDWPGTESSKSLFETYKRILSKISDTIREKHGE